MINILGICDNAEILSVIRLVNILISGIKVIVPIILIVTLSVDFLKATASHDDDAVKKAANNAIRKGVAAVAIFMVPTLISILINLSSGDFEYKTCLANATIENISAAYEARAHKLMDDARKQLTNESYIFAQQALKHIQDESVRQSYAEELEGIKQGVDAKRLVDIVRRTKKDSDYQAAVDAVNALEDKDLRNQLEDELEEISLTMTKYMADYCSNGDCIDNPLGLPHYEQCDSRWGNLKYDIGGGPNGTMATLCSSSCGYTSFSMIAAGLNRNMSITPVTVVEKMRGISISAGQFTRRGYGAASTSELMNSSFMNYYNLKANKVTGGSGESLKQAIMRELNSGKAMIILVPGHYMVLTGSGDGNVVLLDPFSNWRDSRRKSGKQTLDNVWNVYDGIKYAIAYERK
jgi:hypothetical protein